MNRKPLFRLFVFIASFFLEGCKPGLDRNFLEILPFLTNKLFQGGSQFGGGTSAESGLYISGNVTNLVGTGFSIMLNDSETIFVGPSGEFRFNTAFSSGNTYSVRILSQPSTPAQVCTPADFSGVIETNINLQFVCGAPYSPGFVYGVPSSLSTSETGTTLTFTLALATEPNGTVTLDTMSSHTLEATVSPSNLIFNTSNWNIPQTITVTGVPDGVPDPDVNYQITLGNIAGTDTTGYQTLSPQTVPYSFLNTDINTTYSVGGTIAGLSSGAIDLNLTSSLCGANVNTNQSSNGSFSFSTNLNNNCDYTITVNSQPTGQYCTLQNATGTISSSSVTNLLVNCFSAVVDSLTSVAEGQTTNYIVKLNYNPNSTVTVSVSSTIPGSVGISPSSFTMNSGNWSSGVNVTISGLSDANILHESGVLNVQVSSYNIGSSAINVWDNNVGKSRYIYLTSGVHNGDFGGDVSLSGSTPIQKSDSFCKNNIPVALNTKGTFRAILAGGVRDPAGLWPIPKEVDLYNSSEVLIGSTNTSKEVNLTSTLGTGAVWTGLAGFALLGSNCTGWTTSLVLFSGGVGNANSLSNAFVDSLQLCSISSPIYCIQNGIDLKNGSVGISIQDIIVTKCPVGMTYNQHTATCSGSSAVPFCSLASPECDGTVASESPAKQACENLNSINFKGRMDWRLPNVTEAEAMALNWIDANSLFGGVQASDFWTSDISSTTNAKAINGSNGNLSSITKTNALQLFCVSNGI